MNPTRKRLAWAGCIGLLVIVIDQLSKQWALSALADGHLVRVLGDFLGFQLYFNPGAALSLGENATPVFTLIATVVVIAIPFVIRRIDSLGWAIALGLVWGGAAGNLGDRLFRQPGVGTGHVVDFIKYGNWSIGNVADAALVIGVVVIAVLAFFESSSEKDDTPEAAESPDTAKVTAAVTPDPASEDGTSEATPEAGPTTTSQAPSEEEPRAR